MQGRWFYSSRLRRRMPVCGICHLLCALITWKRKRNWGLHFANIMLRLVWSVDLISTLDKKCLCCTISPSWFSCAIGWLCSHVYIYVPSNVAQETVWKRLMAVFRNRHSHDQRMTLHDYYGTKKQRRCDLTSLTNQGCLFQIFKCRQQACQRV